jgi:hypothetical protein
MFYNFNKQFLRVHPICAGGCTRIPVHQAPAHWHPRVGHVRLWDVPLPDSVQAGALLREEHAAEQGVRICIEF